MPSFAYRINDLISVGVGVQMQYAKASLESLASRLLFQAWARGISPGTIWAYGLTAGVTLTPTPTTTIGIG